MQTRRHQQQRWTLGYVEYDSIPATDVKPVDCLPKALFDHVRPEQCVVNTFGFVWDVRHNIVIALSVGIPTGDISLGSNTVPIAPPRAWWTWSSGDHLGAVGHCGTHSKHRRSLLLIVRNWMRLVEWRLRMMCLTYGILVKGLQVHSKPKGTIFLGADHHPVAPGNGVRGGGERLGQPQGATSWGTSGLGPETTESLSWTVRASPIRGNFFFFFLGGGYHT